MCESVFVFSSSHGFIHSRGDNHLQCVIGSQSEHIGVAAVILHKRSGQPSRSRVNRCELRRDAVNKSKDIGNESESVGPFCFFHLLTAACVCVCVCVCVCGSIKIFLSFGFSLGLN